MTGVSLPTGSQTMNGASFMSEVHGSRDSRPRMGPQMNRGDLVFCDVCVDLGSPEVGVSEHGLNGAQIGAPPEKVGSERMAELVRRDRRPDPGRCRVALQEHPEALPRHLLSATDERDGGRRVSQRTR